MTVAVGSRTVGDIVTLATDPTTRWTVHAGTAPATATAPFVSVYLDTPMLAAQPACFEDFGAVRNRWRLNVFAESMDQARWLQGQLVAKEWSDMLLEQIGPVTLDPTEQPDLFMATVVLRDYSTVDV